MLLQAGCSSNLDEQSDSWDQTGRPRRRAPVDHLAFRGHHGGGAVEISGDFGFSSMFQHCLKMMKRSFFPSTCWFLQNGA